MYIKKLLFCVLTIVVITAKAQYPYVVPNTDWIKYYSSDYSLVSGPTALDANSNVYIAGYIGTAYAFSDLVVLKYDSTGANVINYSYDNGGYDIAKAIKIDASGNIIVAGNSEGTATTKMDIVVIKLGPTGSVIYTKRWDAGLAGIDEATDIVALSNGDVIVVGRSQNASGDFDAVVIRLDPAGNIKPNFPFFYTGTGSNMDENATGIAMSADEQTIFVTGITTDMNGTDIVTFALDVNTATPNWGPIVTGGAANGNDRSNAIILCGSNISICGEIDNGASGMDGVLVQYDGSNGTQIFWKVYDAYGGFDRATGLATDSAGNIGVVSIAINGGNYEYHTNLYSSSGVPYGLNKESTGLGGSWTDPKICNDTIAHHWYVSGEAQRATKDVFVYQLSPSGNTAWRHYIDGQASDVDCATGIAVNGVGVVYVGALSKNSVAEYDLTTIKINQTPVYFPPDFANEPVNNGHLYFKNQGQLLRTDTTLASEVLYYTHNTKPEVFIEQDAFNFVFKTADTLQNALDTIERIQYKFLNCNTLANHHEYLPKLTNYNYYLGYALSPAIENVQGNERVFIPNFYPYIDLHYFSGAGGVKFYFVVKPGAMLSEWSMQVNGSVSNNIDAVNGDLAINGNLGDVILGQPIAYTINWLGAVTTITTGTASWNSLGSNKYSINPPFYNHSWPLIIEVAAKTATVPAVNHANLDYSTYYGGIGNESFNDIKAAANGDRHVTGWTDSPQFPPQSSMFLYSAQKDAIVLKYTADDTLRVASFMGGVGEDVGNSVDVNSNNEVFIGGYTWSLDFPAKQLFGASNQTVNGRIPAIGDYQDGFLAKFNPTTTGGKPTLSHNWSRYYGGSGNDAINSICVDGTGNLHFVGEAKSPTLTALVNPAQAMNAGTNNSSDVILGKFDPSLSMVFGTFFGGTNVSFAAASRDIGMDITVDNSGRVIICGRTDATNLGVVNTTGNNNTFYDPTPNSSASYDGFIARYSPTGVKQFASYFGGTKIDAVTRLAHDPVSDDIYFAGDSYDTTAFPFFVKANAFNSRYKTYRSAFVGQMGGDLTKKWCSFYGHGTNSAAYTHSVSGLCVDGYGVLYMSGMTTSDTIQRPLTQPTTVVYKDSIKNNTEGFVAVFNPDQSLYHAHYFGGTNIDLINGADVSQNQKLYVVGNTNSNNFPIAYNIINAALIDSIYNGGDDGFISRFELNHYQVTGISETHFDKTSLNIYPNPTSTGFNLEMQSMLTSKVNMKVFNLMGQLIYEQAVSDIKTSVNCESWTNGVYLISVSDAQSQRTFKLIKN